MHGHSEVVKFLRLSSTHLPLPACRAYLSGHQACSLFFWKPFVADEYGSQPSYVLHLLATLSRNQLRLHLYISEMPLSNTNIRKIKKSARKNIMLIQINIKRRLTTHIESL